MRIIAGEHRGQLLDCPSNDLTRPTTDRVRESLFSILDSMQAREICPTWHNSYVFDGFCGAGTLGLEALSRGAAHASFVDDNPKAIQTCQKNIATCKISNDRFTILQKNILNIQNRPNHLPYFNLIFLDPPYGQNLGYSAMKHLHTGDWFAENCLCIIESDKKHPEQLPDHINILDERLYGRTRLQFIKL